MSTQTVTAMTMPQLGESVTEGTIGAWLKQVGDRIEKYDPLVEVESDKASAELPASISGVLVEILVEPGTTVPVGAELCRIEEVGGATATESQERDQDAAPAPETIETPRKSRPPATNGAKETIVNEATLLRTRSSPVVRRIAEEHGLELSAIDGSGVGGRVTKRDVLAQVETQAGKEQKEVAVESEPDDPAPPSSVPPAGRSSLEVYPGDEVVPLTSMRRAIATNMVHSVQTAPHASCVMEVDMTNVVSWRTARKAEFREREGIDLTYLPIVLKAVSIALREYPRMNAVWDETRIIHRGAINIGVAVALDDGLVAPVIRGADRLSVVGLAHALVELTGKARAGTLTPGELGGGTFTVNNPGTFGSLVSTPILVQPQVGILSTEAIVKRPVVVDDMIGIRSMMNLSLSIDHRALDGLVATRFLAHVKHWLEAVDSDLSLP